MTTSPPDFATTGTTSPVADPTPSGGVADRPGWRRDTAVFLTSQTISLFGSSLVQYAIMWHLTLQTRSGSVMALAAVFGFLPQAVVSVFGGVWADRLNRKMLIIGADAMIAATTLALALFMLAGVNALWLIYLALAIRSVGAGVQMPAVGALLPQIVPTDKLMRVNGINGTIQSAMMLIAPAAAAAVYAGSSIVAVFFVDIVTAVIGIGLLSLIAVPRLVRHLGAGEEHAGYFGDLALGLRYAASHSFVRWVLALYAVVFVLIVAPSYLTPLMIVRTFGAEVWKLTANEILFSVGMIIGGALLATWGGLKNRVVMMVASTVVFGPLADRFTVEAVLVASGVIMFLVVVAAVALPSGRLAMGAAHRHARGPDGS